MEIKHVYILNYRSKRFLLKPQQSVCLFGSSGDDSKRRRKVYF